MACWNLEFVQKQLRSVLFREGPRLSGYQRVETVHKYTYEEQPLAVPDDERQLSMHGSKPAWAAAPPRTAARARERRANFIARLGRRLGTGRDGVRGGRENEWTSTSAKRGRGHRVYVELELYTGMAWASGRWTMDDETRVHGGDQTQMGKREGRASPLRSLLERQIIAAPLRHIMIWTAAGLRRGREEIKRARCRTEAAHELLRNVRAEEGLTENDGRRWQVRVFLASILHDRWWTLVASGRRCLRLRSAACGRARRT